MKQRALRARAVAAATMRARLRLRALSPGVEFFMMRGAALRAARCRCRLMLLLLRRCFQDTPRYGACLPMMPPLATRRRRLRSAMSTGKTRNAPAHAAVGFRDIFTDYATAMPPCLS